MNIFKKNNNHKNTTKIGYKNYLLFHKIQIILFILTATTTSITLITELLFDTNNKISFWLLFSALFCINILACLTWYRFQLKNNINNKKYQIFIFFTIFLFISILTCLLIFFKTNNSFIQKVYSIFYWYGWKTPIILKLWHILAILLIILMFYIVRHILIIKNKFIKHDILLWHKAKDHFNKIQIDFPPYCLKHKKQLQQESQQFFMYLICPICKDRYSKDDLKELHKEVINKINLKK